MHIIDISWPITQDMTAYKDKKVVTFSHTKTFEKDHARESVITLGSHSGTHIDAPSHFIENGKSIEYTPPQAFFGPCVVIDMTHVRDCIRAEDFQNIALQAGSIILFKTTNSALHPIDPFKSDFVYVHASAAQLLADKKIRTVGVDYLGIERGQPNHETHVALMQAGVVIIEGLRLSKVQPGSYTLCCLPLAVVGLEAAPARAILIQKL